MRPRRPVVEHYDVGTVPECLRYGPCVEIWAPDGTNVLEGFRRYNAARLAFERNRGLSTEQSMHSLGNARAPWTVADESVARHYRLHPGDVAALREQAEHLPRE